MRLIVIVADSLRADALGSHTPTVNRLADEGVRFERVVASAPWTVPALSALLSGIDCHGLGLVRWDQPWPARATWLLRGARDAGLEVAAFVFDPDFLLSRVPEAGVVGSSQRTEELLGWVRGHRGDDYLLLVHYWWTHVPYVDRPMDSAAWSVGARGVLRALSAGPAAVAGVKRLYARAVARLSEAWLPRLLEAADADGTWIVLTADHGESWGERRGAPTPRDVFDLHGTTLYDEVLRVPLIVRPPGGCAPRRVRTLVRGVDLAPTVAELCGVPAPSRPALDGRSLAGWLGGADGPAHADAVSALNRDVVSDAAAPLPDDPAELWTALALTTARHKLIWAPASGRRQAFDLRDDPGETDELGADPALAAGWERLARERARCAVGPPAAGDSAVVAARLRELGYVE